MSYLTRMKIHYPKPNSQSSLCGMFAWRSSKDMSRVNCKTCINRVENEKLKRLSDNEDKKIRSEK